MSRPLFPRKRYSPLNHLEEIPYKDVELLKNYLTERGRILPRRIIGANAGAQRALKQAISRARNIALLSFAEGYIPQHEPRIPVQRERPPWRREERSAEGDEGAPPSAGERKERPPWRREERFAEGDKAAPPSAGERKERPPWRREERFAEGDKAAPPSAGERKERPPWRREERFAGGDKAAPPSAGEGRERRRPAEGTRAPARGPAAGPVTISD